MPTPHKDIYFLLIVATLLLGGIGILVGNNLGLTSIGKNDYITVTGTAYGFSPNEVATINVGVTAINSDRAEAVKQLNEKMDNIIGSIKNFGIPENDIKTSNYSIYQEQVWDAATQSNVFKDWHAYTSIDVTVREVDHASSLVNLLSTLEIDNVYGPNFTTDNDNPNEANLLISAMDNAHGKAQKVAAASGRSLGKMVSFVEGYSGSSMTPMYGRGMGGGGGADFEPGTTEVGRTVTVTYVLR